MEQCLNLKDYLVDSGSLTEDEFLQAEDYAFTRKITIERSLVFLNLLSYETLGDARAELTGKAYHPLLNSPPPDSAKSQIPVKFADQWKIFPINYDSKKNRLTLACAEPDHEALQNQLKTIFPGSLQLDFAIATSDEIQKAIDVYYKGKSYKQNTELNLPRDFTIIMPAQTAEDAVSLEETKPNEKKIVLIEPDVTRAGPLKTLLKGEGYRDVQWISSPAELPAALRDQTFDLLVVNGRSFPPKGSWLKAIPDAVELPPASYYNPATLLAGQDYPYQQMSEALISLASAFIRKKLKEEPDRIQEILTRVRYCKLLALRLDLYQAQVDGAVLAAWLSASKENRDLLKQIETPFNLEDIVYPPDAKDKTIRVEAAILKLIAYYQILKRKNPQIADDLDQLRRLLIKNLPSAGIEAYLEVFLNLLKNEEFLKDIDKSAGRILVVDNTLSLTSRLAVRLNNDGFEVVVVPAAGQALKKLGEGKYDLIISEVKLPDTDGLKFCRIVRSNASTANIPLFFFTEEENERLPAESLEAGADDFMKKPGDLEVLSLKIQRVLVTRSAQETKGGLTGSLEEMSSTDFIQSLSAGEKSVKITIKTETEEGNIYLEKGDIIHAHTGDFEGEDAFYRCVIWEKGRFQIVSCSNFPSRTIHGSALSLLLEASRRADEANSGDNDDTDA